MKKTKKFLWCQIDFLIICNFFWSNHFLIMYQTKILLWRIHVSLGPTWKNPSFGVPSLLMAAGKPCPQLQTSLKITAWLGWPWGRSGFALQAVKCGWKSIKSNYHIFFHFRIEKGNPDATKTKGQLISKCPFGFIVRTEIPTKKFDRFCPKQLYR